jgi:hypothetical protein
VFKVDVRPSVARKTPGGKHNAYTTEEIPDLVAGKVRKGSPVQGITPIAKRFRSGIPSPTISPMKQLMTQFMAGSKASVSPERAVKPISTL